MKVEKIFNMLAKDYDKTEEVRFEQHTIKTIENTKKYLKASDVVLDYGCATGTKALELAGKVKKIYAIDISSKMIELAKRKLVESKIENVNFEKATIFDNRFKTESFDVITAFNILHLLEDSRQDLQRITDLLKPGGLFISTTPCLGEKMSRRDKFVFSLVVLLMKIRLFPYIERFKFSEIEDLIAHGNLQIVETEKSYHGLSGCFIVAKKRT
jgi:ubiquinone/menaquinone biosynthesis C-methylase UbiE